VQLAEYAWPWSYETSSTALAPVQRIRPDERMIEGVADLIERFDRVILVAGRGAADNETANEIRSLADEIGALLGTTLLARGLFLGHQYDVGTLGAFSSAPTEALLAETELVVSFGASLNYFTSEGGFLFSDAEVVRIDAAPQGPKIDYGNAMYLQADAYEAAVALRGALGKRGVSPRSGYRTRATDEALTAPVPDLRRPSEESLKTSVDPRDVMRLLDDALPDNVRVVCGVGHFWNFFTMYSQPRPETILSYQFGSIGQTLPVAIGAAMADSGRPTLLIEGDGSLMMHLQELDTAARYNLDIVILVMNDSAFGAEVHKLNAYGLDPEPAKIPTPDFSEVARSLGFRKGGMITAAEDLQGSIIDAFVAGGPHLFDIRVNPEILADTYLRLHFGQPNQGPRLTPTRPSGQ
jgi:thiamine pyrophosphate-dependent acetolactate synthase large subunit-like protein